MPETVEKLHTSFNASDMILISPTVCKTDKPVQSQVRQVPFGGLIIPKTLQFHDCRHFNIGWPQGELKSGPWLCWRHVAH